MKLQFKFNEASNTADRKKVIRELNASGAQNVRRLFPEEEDAELAALYMVDYTDESTGQGLLKLLQSEAAVQFAEGEVRRKLIPGTLGVTDGGGTKPTLAKKNSRTKKRKRSS